MNESSKKYFFYWQRVLDIALVLMAGPIWLPLLLLLALLTYADSGRPLFFRQVRMGFKQQPFTLIKIRTMVPGRAAPAAALFAGWTYAADPRVTRLGKILRRYRLDELPQLFNVLRGEMSLVGPRPEPFEIAETLGRTITNYHCRHEVRPGLTGLCQLSPRYIDIGTIEKSAAKLLLDLEWVAQPSIISYLSILLRTVKVVIAGVGIA
jgi:lipopolysaccharide/colanic/teichoic acid biosynthesis glycosyltransferase